MTDDHIVTIDDALDHLVELRNSPIAQLHILYLDEELRLITKLKMKPIGVIVAVNTFDKEARPGMEDLNMLKDIQIFCELWDVRLIDYLIVAKQDYFSFREHTNLL